MSSIETYRGTVYRWEVDNVDHFTVAYYFARFEDATLALLHAAGLDPGSLAGSGAACATEACHVRYLRELRVNDILHIESGVIDISETGLELGHQVFDSDDGTLCTTVEQRVALVRPEGRAPVPLGEAHRAAAESLRIEWAPGRVADLVPPRSESVGFRATARDTIKPWEVDTLGYAAFPAYIHRFSAANGQLLGAFGMTQEYLRAERRGFSTFEFKLLFPGSLRAGDRILVRSALVHVGNSSMRFLHRMANAGTGGEVALLEQSGVHLDMEARRPTALPAALRDRAKAMLVPA
jgi:acyl-CoA thioesterase FadM